MPLWTYDSNEWQAVHGQTVNLNCTLKVCLHKKFYWSFNNHLVHHGCNEGLGEMMPAQLWETTLDPQQRLLKQLVVEDAAEANVVFSSLMGARVSRLTWKLLQFEKLWMIVLYSLCFVFGAGVGICKIYKRILP